MAGKAISEDEGGWLELKGLLALDSVVSVGRGNSRDREWLWVRLKGGELIRRSVDDLMIGKSLGVQEARDSAVRALRLAVEGHDRAQEFRDRGKRLRPTVEESPFVLRHREDSEEEPMPVGPVGKPVPANKVSGPTDAELRLRFSHHPPGSGSASEGEDVVFYQEFRAKCLELARYVVKHTRPSREQSRALTALDDVCFNGNAARARRGRG